MSSHFNTPSERFIMMLALGTKGAERGDSVGTPIVHASTYHQAGTPAGPFQYGRWSNPTWTALEQAIGVLEDAPVVIFPSGMAAISAAILSQVQSGDRILMVSDGYGATRAFAQQILNKFDVSASYVATKALLDQDLSPFKLVFMESPSNPGLDLCDITALAEHTKAVGAKLIVDNTTMTPLGQLPLELGADIVVASDTKALNGHSDVLMGHVASKDNQAIEKVRAYRNVLGMIPGPQETAMVLRGLETLDVRFERMCANAEIIARLLSERLGEKSVRFPGLPHHDDHDLAKMQMQRFGTLIGLDLKTEAVAEDFIKKAQFLPATSFGGVHTSAERRARWGDAVSPGYVRLSIGCEPCDQLVQAIGRALS